MIELSAMARAVAATPPATAAPRATRSTLASSAPGFRNRA